jgi:hypothetical protein
MTPRLALLMLLFAACDEADDREAHPIVLPPAAPSEQKRSDGEDVSPLSPIVLPKEATPPPTKPEPTPPPMQRTEVEAPVTAPPPPEPVEPAKPEVVEAPVAAAPEITKEKPVSPVVKKPPAKKTAKKKSR